MFGLTKDPDAATLRHETIAESIGKLLLRITIGGLMLFHGVNKIQNGIGGITGMVQGAGLPGFLAYGVYVGEVVVPILIIIGLFTRMSSLILAFNMVVAIALAHAGDLFSIGGHGEWAIESPMLYLLPSIVIALLGPGRFAVHRRTGPLA